MPNEPDRQGNQIASEPGRTAQVDMRRIFLLSPAWLGGRRTEMLLREEAGFDLAVRLRKGQATIGDVYSFISGLYFRGKLAYDR